MKASLDTLLRRIPHDARFVKAFSHGSMSVELYAPLGIDPQMPHDQDELYFVQAGRADFYLNGETEPCQAGDCFFVPAGAEHRFLNFTHDFVTWVVFWGPKGGEKSL